MRLKMNKNRQQAHNEKKKQNKTTVKNIILYFIV